MTYEVLGPGPLDYLPCRYGTSRLIFRGPKRSLDPGYVAFLGGTETYGKFIPTPFPALVERAINQVCVNFGQLNAGIDAFSRDPFVLEAAARADVTVIQILGAQNLTNRFYSVHPRRNDRFVTASAVLKAIFRDVDFSEFHFNKHMLDHLYHVSAERFYTVRQELQEAWVARMLLLLQQIPGKTVLLWLADHAPEPASAYAPDGIGADPLFVTRDMIDRVSESATALVEVVISPEARSRGTEGMLFNEMEEAAAAKLPGPFAHREVAQALAACLNGLQT